MDSPVGVLGYSPLFYLDNFDVVEDVVLDEFHLLKEGLAKNMLVRVFTDSAEGRAILAAFDKAHLKMKTFRCTPRRTRSGAYVPDYKGELRCTRVHVCLHELVPLFHAGNELGVVLYSGFPHLVKDAMRSTALKNPLRR